MSCHESLGAGRHVSAGAASRSGRRCSARHAEENHLVFRFVSSGLPSHLLLSAVTLARQYSPFASPRLFSSGSLILAQRGRRWPASHHSSTKSHASLTLTSYVVYKTSLGIVCA